MIFKHIQKPTILILALWTLNSAHSWGSKAPAENEIVEAPPVNKAPDKPQWVEGQILVKLKDTVTDEQVKPTLDSLLKEHQLTFIEKVGETPGKVTRLFLVKTQNKKIEDVIPTLKKDPNVSYAEPNIKMFLFKNQK